MDSAPVKLPPILSWAVYLACSWTWCIGMWLPVILLRDFGVWSFAVFAVPNVLGAMAMGLVLRRPGASEALVASHRTACHAFSFITVAFQTFFLIWIIAGVGVPSIMKLGLLAVFLLPAMLVGDAGTGSLRSRLVTAIVYLVSLGAGGYWIVRGSFKPFTAPPTDAVGLASLAAVCTLGFLLSPYLDLTFHNARQRLAGRAGSAAFIVGFGVLFLVMIVFTFLYAQPTLVDAKGRALFPALASWAVIIHMLAQLGLTDGLHSAVLREDATKPTLFSAMGGGGAMILALVLFFLPISNETLYRGFMGMYGLVFPAYVCTCVRRDLSPPTMAQFAAFIATILIAGPMFYLGFIEKRYAWMAAGVGVVLASRAATLTPRPPAQPAA